MFSKVLQPHESELLSRHRLVNVTHEKARSVILEAPSANPVTALKLFAAKSTAHKSVNDLFVKYFSTGGGSAGLSLVYRPVADAELSHLLTTKELPDTQPYQAIMPHPSQDSESGRAYAERYVLGTKQVDTAPATVVEFVVPSQLLEQLFAKQQKPEDGCLSHGLGSKAARTLRIFNTWLVDFVAAFSGVVQQKKQQQQDTEYDDEDGENGDDDNNDDDDGDHDESSSSSSPPEDDFLWYGRAWRIVKVKRRLP